MDKIKKLLDKKELSNAREEVRQNQKQYRNEIKKLISNQKIEGIVFGRFYLNDSEIKKMLYSIMDDDQLGLSIRVQSLYEILTEGSTAEEKKEQWFKYLLSHIAKFAKFAINAYNIEIDADKEKYFLILKEKKIPSTPVNKRWVYFIELIALFRERTETGEIIRKYSSNNNHDAFLQKVAEKCLRYLEAR